MKTLLACAPGFVFGLALFGCSALFAVTPADRASAYAREAQGISALCKAYKFDRAAGLVGEVPEMARVCE